MNNLMNDKLEKYLDELSDEYKKLLCRALLKRSKSIDDLSISELLRLDNEIKKPLIGDYKNKQRRAYTLFRSGIIYMIAGAFIFLISKLFWKNDHNGIGNIYTMISCVMAFVGFIFVLYSFAYQVFDLGYSSHNVSLEEDYKVLQYEIIIKWRQLEGIVNDISLNSIVNTSYSVIQFLIKNHFINNEESNVLKKFLEMRNNIVHSMDDNYTTEELKTMINKIDKIIIKLNKIV